MHIGLVVIIALAVLAFIISRRPSEFRVTRTGVISAPAAVIFPHVNELVKWQPWSPWAKLDPNAKTTFEGPASGTGAVMRWAGNRNVGEGSMTITESRAPDFIRFRLDFIKPFKGVNTAEFTFTAEGGQTIVTWSMDGKSNFMSKLISCIVDCEKMVGKQFEKGLASLREVVEAGAR